jgi:hypothetical protein
MLILSSKKKTELGTRLFFCSTEWDSKFVRYIDMWQHVAVDSNCHGQCCQNYKTYKTFPGLMKNRHTISVSVTFSKTHSRLMMDTSCQPDTPTQQMKHQVCEHFCIITGSNGQDLLCVMANALYIYIYIYIYIYTHTHGTVNNVTKAIYTASRRK